MECRKALFITMNSAVGLWGTSLRVLSRNRYRRSFLRSKNGHQPFQKTPAGVIAESNVMAMPQRDNLIDEIVKTDALLEYAVMHGEIEEAERLRAGVVSAWGLISESVL